RDFSCDWPELLGVGQSLIEDPELEQRAEAVCRQLVTRLQPAIVGSRERFLSEDYLVYVLHELEGTPSADDLTATRGDTMAALLRGERQPLSEQEKTKILDHRLSYLRDDLVIPTWNAAF